MNEYLSLKELDNQLGQPKGTGFRLFKAKLQSLTEGEDFILLDAELDAATIKQLKAEDRVYPHSRNVVMLTKHSFEMLKTVTR